MTRNFLEQAASILLGGYTNEREPTRRRKVYMFLSNGTEIQVVAKKMLKKLFQII